MHTAFGVTAAGAPSHVVERRFDGRTGLQAISAAARHNVWRIGGRTTAVETILKRGTILRSETSEERGEC